MATVRCGARGRRYGQLRAPTDSYAQGLLTVPALEGRLDLARQASGDPEERPSVIGR